MSDDKARDAFEKWFLQSPGVFNDGLHRHISGKYSSFTVQLQWATWQAATESQRRMIEEKDVLISNQSFVMEELKTQASKSLGDAMKIIEEKEQHIGILTDEADEQNKIIEQLQSRVRELEEAIDENSLWQLINHPGEKE